METLKIENDIHLFGREVKTFPQGIGEAFDALQKEIPDGLNRAWYGLSRMKEGGGILYIAAAAEKFPGEAGKYNCQRYIIKKGAYMAETIPDWMKNIGHIKDAFDALLKDEWIDTTAYCVEWYKSDEEMVCMVKILESKPVQASH